MVEAVRVGTIITDWKAHQRWKSIQATRHAIGAGTIGLSGDALERVVMGIAVSHPDLVAVRAA